MAKHLTMREYNDQKAAFYRKHFGERGGRESGSVDGETIRKTVCFEDGHVWNEITEPLYEKIEVEKYGLKFSVLVKMYRTEIWDSEDSSSRYLYEKHYAA